MNVFIAGGTGFVGVNLANSLLASGHDVTVLGSGSQHRPAALRGEVKLVVGDGRRPGPWQEGVSASGLVINLAGASIFARWTAARKRLIADSRILTTRNIVDALPAESTLFSTSAVGYYGFRGDEIVREEDSCGSDFLAGVCRQWEAEARRAEEMRARVVITRFGIVLGKGGALAQMLPVFRLGLGGRIGSGRQWFSWIHMDDLIGAMKFLLDDPHAAGAYNLTAPEPVRNRDLAASLGRVLQRPAFVPAPGFLVRLAMGELGNVVLRGQRVVPARLQEAGYPFLHARLEEAIRAALLPPAA